MRILPIRTGTVRVHERQRRGEGRGVTRSLRTLLDRTWTEPLPIYAWLIEHPEGLIVVDTGETARTAEHGYFPRWHPYYRLGVRFAVRPEEEIGPQLIDMGVQPAEVRWVILTHLHTDHAGGLHHFPHSEFLVTRVEYVTARGMAGKVRGYLPHRWPTWFAPRLIEFGNLPLGPFRQSLAVTRADDVRIVPTPGHTKGHCSVVVIDEEHTVFLAGDTTYSEELLLQRALDGVCAMGGGERAARKSIDRVLELARLTEMTYLPSHETDGVRRLRERQSSTGHAERHHALRREHGAASLTSAARRHTLPNLNGTAARR
jgi:glyoxylase-like metal-dependent hydrolase (beta-lactamase superfamily II)